MAGSWLPDDLRRKIEEEKYRNRNQKQSTTSSSSNGWFQNILDINNKNKSSLSSSDVHLQSREQFFDHCKRKFEEDNTTIKYNSQKDTVDERYCDQSFMTLEEVDNYQLPSKFISDSDQLLRDICNMNTNKWNIDSNESSSDSNNEEEYNNSEEEQVYCSESIHSFIKSSLQQKGINTCARSCCQSVLNHTNDTEIKNSVFRQTILEISVC